MFERPFSFKFFVNALGYHREVRKGKGVFVKKIDRKRQSIISHEVFREEYSNVCNKLRLHKEKNIKNAT